jgi:hypothetical protein
MANNFTVSGHNEIPIVPGARGWRNQTHIEERPEPSVADGQCLGAFDGGVGVKQRERRNRIRAAAVIGWKMIWLQ